jgi:hypothetical protein
MFDLYDYSKLVFVYAHHCFIEFGPLVHGTLSSFKTPSLGNLFLYISLRQSQEGQQLHQATVQFG